MVEVEKVGAGQHIKIGGITLLPIIRTSVSYRSANQGIAYSSSKSVIGVVVISPKRKYAIDMDGEEVALEQYLEQVPEVKERLQGM